MPELNIARSLYGAPVAPASLKGKVVLLHVWDANVDQGLDPIEEVAAVYDKYKDQGVIVISLVGTYCDDTVLHKKAVKHKVVHPVVVVDDARLGKWWSIALSGVGAESGSRYIVVDRKGFAVSSPSAGGLDAAVQKQLSK